MLFHVTLIHDAAHCPGHHPELGQLWMESFKKKGEIAKQLGVEVHNLLSAGPEHVVYVIVEAERPMQVAMFVAQLLPTEQAEIRMSAVETLDDVLEFLQSIDRPPAK